MHVNSDMDLRDEKNSGNGDNQFEYEYDRRVNHCYLKNQKNKDTPSIGKKGLRG